MMSHTLFSHKHISPTALPSLWYNAIGMIPSSSFQSIHRKDDNMLENGKFHFQVRHVVDQVAATRLVVVHRASKYEFFTFLLTFFPKENIFPAKPWWSSLKRRKKKAYFKF